MNFKQFFLFFLPFLVLVIFIKNFLQNLFLLPLGDIFLSLGLAVLVNLNLNLLVYIYLLMLGIVDGLEKNLEVFMGVFFVFLGILTFYLKKYIPFEHIKTKMLFWILSILGFFVLRLVIFISEVYLSLSLDFLVSLILKMFNFLIFTFLWILVFDMILRKQRKIREFSS